MVKPKVLPSVTLSPLETPATIGLTVSPAVAYTNDAITAVATSDAEGNAVTVRYAGL